MSCNSCSNITLPGVVGPAGAPGAAGAAGNGIVSVSFQSTTNPGGTPAVAGYTDTYRITYTDAPTFDYNIVNGTVGTDGTNGTSIIEIDTTLGAGITSQTSPITPQKSFNIPANTWQNDGDMVEMEIMAVGEEFVNLAGLPLHKIYLTIGEAPGTVYPIDISTLGTAWFGAGYTFSNSKHEPFFHLKTQLSMSSSGTITPITDIFITEGLYTDESTNIFTDVKLFDKQRGANLTSVPVGSDIPIKVYLVSADGSVNMKLFYFKLTSYKA